MKKKILLTGGGGFAAGNIISQANIDSNFEIHAIELREVPFNQERLIWHILDLQDSERLKDTFYRVQPDVLVHAAAISDIDYCEAHRDIAENVNTDVTALFVTLCREMSCRLIYFSSDSVFDGSKGNYTEEDQAEPINVYARTKVKSENIIKQHAQNWVIIRPSLIMGLPVWEAGNSFFWRMVKSLQKGKEVAFPKGEIRSPIDVITLSKAILEIANHAYSGILHLSGNNAVSRFDMARRIADRLGYPKNLVVDREPVIDSGRAPRPVNVSLCNKKAQMILKTPMLSLDEGIDLILTSKGEIGL